MLLSAQKLLQNTNIIRSTVFCQDLMHAVDIGRNALSVFQEILNKISHLFNFNGLLEVLFKSHGVVFLKHFFVLIGHFRVVKNMNSVFFC